MSPSISPCDQVFPHVQVKRMKAAGKTVIMLFHSHTVGFPLSVLASNLFFLTGGLRDKPPLFTISSHKKRPFIPLPG